MMKLIRTSRALSIKQKKDAHASLAEIIEDSPYRFLNHGAPRHLLRMKQLTPGTDVHTSFL